MVVDKDIQTIIDKIMITENIRKKCICRRCGKSWFTKKKGSLPKQCTFCKSPYWNQPYENEIMSYLTGSKI